MDNSSIEEANITLDDIIILELKIYQSYNIKLEIEEREYKIKLEAEDTAIETEETEGTGDSIDENSWKKAFIKRQIG